ncbi:MAG TPA: hypothetical protein VGE29_12750 [Prosthecobacter sp.]
MQRSTHLFLLAAVTASLASCYGPDPRPFAGRGRSLDQPPRYGDPNRYVDPTAHQTPPPPPGPAVPPPDLDPGAPTPPPSVDPGLSVAPTTPTTPGGTVTPPAGTPPAVTPPAPTPTTPAPSGSTDVPYARAVPGKPGFVYSPKDPKKIISVEGLRPGQKARDPETGDIFRVPY